MILNEFIKIKINTKTDRTYYKLGYYDKSIKDEIIFINVKIKDLNKSSRQKVDVKCDICGKENKISYLKYLKNIEKYNIYTCIKCSQIKNKKTKLEKYGDENYNNREKSKQTCLKKYNVENPQQNNIIKNKRIKTNNKKYGGTSPRSSKSVQNKQTKTILNKYGNDYYIKWRNNIITILYEKYGDKNYNNRKKFKQTCLKKYGVENPMNFKIILDKVKEKKLETGTYLTEEKRNKYKNYWLKVNRITMKNKNKLFENWNGNDYYDNEYIKENFNLKYTDRLYPTIDHIISVKYGFDNNLSPKFIGSLKNLAITKRWINSSKNKNITFNNKLKK